mgnify:CR=1 FL=1
MNSHTEQLYTPDVIGLVNFKLQWGLPFIHSTKPPIASEKDGGRRVCVWGEGLLLK